MPKVRKARFKRRPVESAIGVVITIAALYFGQDVLIPLALAVLLTFLLTPLASRLQRFGLSPIPSVLFTTLMAFLVIVGLGTIVGTQLVSLADNFDSYKHEIGAKYEKISRFGGKLSAKFDKIGKDISHTPAAPTSQPVTQPTVGNYIGVATEQFRSDPEKATLQTLSNTPSTAPATQSATQQPRGESADKPVYVVDASAQQSPVRLLLEYVDKALSPLGTGALVIVFTVFMLLDRQDLRDRAIRLVSRGKYTVTTKALDDAGGRISRYMLAQTIVNGSYGLVVGLGLYVIGLTFGDKGFPSFVLWGLLAAVLRFIPYVGPVTAAAFPLALSLVVYEGFTVFVAVGVMLVLIELISNNVMEPWLYGSSTGLSTMAILVAAVFWTWLWGPIGLFMSTPLTVCIVVLGKHVRQLTFLDVLLGDQPALPPGVRFYQRLLAGDANEAESVMNEHAKHDGGHRVPDDVLVPALLMARRDHRDGDLTAEEETTLMTTAEKLLAKRSVDCEARADLARQKSDAGAATVADPCPLRVIGCPAHHRSEELAMEALNQLGLPDLFCMDVLSSRLMHGQVEEKIRETNPQVIYIAIVPPGGGPQARYLCRRLRNSFPDIPIVVGYFGRVRDFDRLLIRFRRVGASYVTTSIAQGQKQIMALLKRTQEV